MNGTQRRTIYADADNLAEAMGAVRRWWLCLPERGPIHSHDLDVMALLIGSLENRARHIADALRRKDESIYAAQLAAKKDGTDPVLAQLVTGL